MNNARKYIDQIGLFINSEAKKHKEINKILNDEFFKSETLKQSSKIALNAICNLLSYNILNDADFENYYQIAIVEFTSNHPIEIIPSKSLDKNKTETWLNEVRRKEIYDNELTYTSRYFRFLKKKGRPVKVLDETLRSSRKILGKLGDPKSDNSFYIKGLVVGSVQSGKTENFNAVINGALDAGYSLIIVLSGIMEDLRSQTQLRIENDVAGQGVINIITDQKGPKGVGLEISFGESGKTGVPQVIMPTSRKQDFNMTLKEADFSLNNRNILVCKKNTSVLKNLILWLSEYLVENKDKHDIPLLIVDDEADNASLNNMGAKGKEYASKINGHIRALLGLFTRKSYLGYTATPFANVLQDRNEEPESKWIVDYKKNGKIIRKELSQVDNIFPDDFIELLFPPSNYIGAKHFFETRIEDIKKIEPLLAPVVNDFKPYFPVWVNKNTGEAILDYEEDLPKRKSKKDDLFPGEIPQSLKEAIQCFIISTAIRLSRKSVMSSSNLYNQHNTRLIHVSRITSWLNRTKLKVEEYVNDYLIPKINNDSFSDPKSVFGELEKIWNKYYIHAIENIRSYLPEGYEDQFLIPKTFIKDIRPLLVEAVKDLEIKAINSETGDSLTYPENIAKKYIAIGGNRLSRGFTLEGLTINYFIRNTDYADTLLQMGRWFGYRPGYLDCCKLFSTAANFNKFDLTTLTVEELEQEFKTMSIKGRKPENFMLRVKTHPKVIQITRSSILKGTVTEQVNYSGDIEQSTKFIIEKVRIEEAWASFRNHVRGLSWESDNEKGFFIHRTDSKGVLKFLELKNTFANLDLPGLPEWLRLCNERGKLTNWTIAIKRNIVTKNPKIPLSKLESYLPEDMNLTIRRGPARDSASRDSLITDNIFKASGKSAQIVAAGEDFSITLNEQEKKRAEDNFRSNKIEEFIKENLSPEDAKNKAQNITIPEKAYRLEMNERDGILLIYLIDLKRVFEVKDGEPDTDLQDYASKRNLDTKVPLIGYAIGFPAISEDIGGVYVKGDFELDIPEDDFEEEFDESLNEETN